MMSAMLNSISSIFKLILQTHHKYSLLNINLEYQAKLTPNYGVKTIVKHFAAKKDICQHKWMSNHYGAMLSSRIKNKDKTN